MPPKLEIDPNATPDDTRSDINGFPLGRFLIRSVHSKYSSYRHRFIKAMSDHGTPTGEIIAWIDDSKGNLKEVERSKECDDQVFFVDEDGRLHSKAWPESAINCRYNPKTRNFELVLQPPQKSDESFNRRACRFYYNGTSRTIGVWAPIIEDSESGPQDLEPMSANSVSSSWPRRSFSGLIRQTLVLELIAQRHYGSIVKFWNSYTGFGEDQEDQPRPGVDETDDSWHRGREIRVVTAQDQDGLDIQTTKFQQWDIIELK